MPPVTISCSGLQAFAQEPHRAGFLVKFLGKGGSKGMALNFFMLFSSTRVSKLQGVISEAHELPSPSPRAFIGV